MGGLIALDQALRYPEGLSGVISSAAHLGNPPIAPLEGDAGPSPFQDMAFVQYACRPG